MPVAVRPLTRDPTAAYLGSLLPATRKTQGQALELIASVLSDGACDASSMPWERLSPEHTRTLRSWLSCKYRPSTVERHLSALRGVLREAWCLRLISAENYYRAALLTRGAPGQGGARALRQGELRGLLSVCTVDESPAGTRDTALILLVFRCGLRPAEAISLDEADYDVKHGTLRLRATRPELPERQAIAAPAARRALESWVSHRLPDYPPLLQGIGPGGVVDGSRLTMAELSRMIRARRDEAGLAGDLPW